jgi:hypothetical protein
MSGNGTGPVVDAVNGITDARGLPHRSQYLTIPGPEGTLGQTFTINGPNNKEQQRMIWWQNEVGGNSK